MIKCEHCGMECESQEELDIQHRACRLKKAFPGAYSERSDGLVTFNMQQVAEVMGMFRDIIVGRDGQPLHPLEGDLHFRIRAGWKEPEVWVELPVRVGNCLTSFAYRITEDDWRRMVQRVAEGLHAANKYIASRIQAKEGGHDAPG